MKYIKISFFAIFLLGIQISFANYLYDVGTNAAVPNVLIIFDTSGSMTFDTTGRTSGSGCWEDGDEGGCATGGDGSADYPGLNPTGNRMYIAKQAISSVLASIPTARYGLMRYYQRESSSKTLDGYWYRNSSGQELDLYYSGDKDPSSSDYNCSSNNTPQVLVNIGDDTVSSILTWMDGVETYPTNKELRGDGATPLAASLKAAGNYFKNTVIPNDGSKVCRSSYVILVTDGLETCSGDPCKEAKNLRTVKVSSETYDVKTYVVGLAIPEQYRSNLNCIAQNGGTGEPLFADDVTELTEVLTHTLNEIIAGDYNASSPTITTIAYESYLKNRIADNTLLVTGFSLPNWNGSLKAYEIFSETSAYSGEFVRNDPLTLKWDAGERLSAKSSSDRTLFTWVNDSRVDFTEANAAALNPYLGIADDTEYTQTKKFIRYLRGIDAYDDDLDGNSSEDRIWKLGDIYHSTPLVVGPPPYTFDEDSYRSFKQQYYERPQVVYVGANDGMLHAFDALTGEELWGFVPPSLLSQLDDQIATHQFYVDLSPKADDAKLSLSWSTTGWSTVLMVGQGWGGKAYSALDITDPATPRLLWEFSDSQRLGESWSVPSIGRIFYSNEEHWVAVFGSGDSPTSGNGTLFVVDIKTGATVTSFTESGTTFVADPVLVNVNPEDSERVDMGYVGDMGGRLHKFSLNSSDPSQWEMCRFYTFGSSKPIVSSTAIQKDESTGDYFVMVGSGLDTVENQGNEQEFVILRDDELTAGCGQADKECQINLTTGERVITTGTANDGVLYFTTYLPEGGASNSCTTGQSFLRCVNFETCDESCDIAGGAESVSVGEGKATDPVSADDHIFFVLSTGTIADIGDPDAAVNQEAPFTDELFYHPQD
ncbi:MAG: PQQ-binding-like beta-propeller repeat protein [Deltaproteobacteria bacterium]|nr:PQQ-binding-like beta-propeller repeat protein [Deltaproteobacteria bacterium]